MSRKNRKRKQQQNAITNANRAANNVKKKQKEQAVRRFIVPLADWKRYEKFMEHLPHIEEALTDLSEDWDTLKRYLLEAFVDEDSFETVEDDLRRIADLIKGIGSVKKRSYYDKPICLGKNEIVNNRPKYRYENLVAEILIEDVSDE